MKIGKKFVRTNFLVDRKYQLLNILFASILVTIACAAFGYIVYLRTYSTAQQNILMELNFVRNKDINISPIENVKALASIFSIIFLSTVSWALFHSHRIAGPSWRFKKVLDSIAAGRFNHTVVLRKGDYLKDLATKFNETLKDLNARQSSHISIVQEIQGQIDNLVSVLNSQNPSEPELQNTAKRISGNISRLSKI